MTNDLHMFKELQTVAACSIWGQDKAAFSKCILNFFCLIMACCVVIDVGCGSLDKVPINDRTQIWEQMS
jgi:hypothetical protein